VAYTTLGKVRAYSTTAGTFTTPPIFDSAVADEGSDARAFVVSHSSQHVLLFGHQRSSRLGEERRSLGCCSASWATSFWHVLGSGKSAAHKNPRPGGLKGVKVDVLANP